MLPYSDGKDAHQLPNGLCIPVRPSRSRFLSFLENSTPHYYQNIIQIPQLSTFAQVQPNPYKNEMGSMLPSSSNKYGNQILFSQNSPALSISIESINSANNNKNNQKELKQSISTTLHSKTNQNSDEHNKTVGSKVIQRKLFASKIASDRKQKVEEEKHLGITTEKAKESQDKLSNKLNINLHLNLEDLNLDTNLAYENKTIKTCEKVKKPKQVIGLISCCDEFFSDIETGIQLPYHSKIMKRKELRLPQTERIQDIETRKLHHVNLEINDEEKIVKKENKVQDFPIILESNSSESKIDDSSHSNQSIDQATPFNFAKAVNKVEARFANVSRRKSDLRRNEQLYNPKKMSDSKLENCIQKNSPPHEMMNLGEI